VAAITLVRTQFGLEKLRRSESSQSVLAKQLYRACLRSLLARFLDIGDGGAHVQPREPSIQYAVAVKVDLTAIARFNKTEFTSWIEKRDRPNWLAFMVLHLTLQTANMILELPARSLEGIIEGEV
jgi:hypothetical protein